MKAAVGGPVREGSVTACAVGGSCKGASSPPNAMVYPPRPPRSMPCGPPRSMPCGGCGSSSIPLSKISANARRSCIAGLRYIRARFARDLHMHAQVSMCAYMSEHARALTHTHTNTTHTHHRSRRHHRHHRYQATAALRPLHHLPPRPPPPPHRISRQHLGSSGGLGCWRAGHEYPNCFGALGLPPPRLILLTPNLLERVVFVRTCAGHKTTRSECQLHANATRHGKRWAPYSTPRPANCTLGLRAVELRFPQHSSS
jgi:hypothetical protein